MNVFFQALSFTFLTPYGIGYSLFYTTPLIFTGLSAALCFQAGLFNIGAEGQLLWGSIAIVALASLFPDLPPALAFFSAAISAGVFGGIWAGVAGYLKATRQIPEVLTTLLLNFVAVFAINYLVLYPFKNPDSQSAESFVLPTPFWLNPIFSPTTPVNWSLPGAIFCAGLVYFILYRTAWGLEIRSWGINSRASQMAGISRLKTTVFVFVFSGALAGLVGLNEVLGNEHKLVEGFSSGYGFTGIAVALLARNHPLWVIPSALFFGVLQTFSHELEFYGDNISKEFSWILQALLILVVSIKRKASDA